MTNEIEVKIPDIGGATKVDVIEILVKVGDEINKDTPLVTLESDKASMEIPSPVSGKVTKIKVKLGDKVSQNDTILYVTGEKAPEPVKAQEKEVEKPVEEPVKPVPVENTQPQKSKEIELEKTQSDGSPSGMISAGPAVRRIARELGVNLEEIKGSGRLGRVTKEDLQSYVKSRLQQGSGSGGLNLPSMPSVDFSQFGEIDIKPLNKIKKVTGIQVHRSWVTIPHVTQFDEADITDLEAFRKSEADKSKATDYKLTLLAFVCSVVCKALQHFPQFNASLDANGDNLIYKKYCNIGIAVETPNGLVVPVIKNANHLSVVEIAKEMMRLSTKAREKGLMPNDMSGGCFTISSLGGIGGTAFTPIVNSPEVAILGLSRSIVKPIYINEEFQPRLMLPLSLSYDHRVIDGAEAARFSRYLCESLSDIRRILL